MLCLISLKTAQTIAYLHSSLWLVACCPPFIFDAIFWTSQATLIRSQVYVLSYFLFLHFLFLHILLYSHSVSQLLPIPSHPVILSIQCFSVTSYSFTSYSFTSYSFTSCYTEHTVFLSYFLFLHFLFLHILLY